MTKLPTLLLPRIVMFGLSPRFSPPNLFIFEFVELVDSRS